MPYSTPILLSLALASILAIAGCASSAFVPYSLDSIEETTTVLARTPTGEPELHILTHVDGVGWSVRGEQAVRREMAVTIRERWGGSTYTAGSTGRQTVLTAMTPLMCPGSLVADLGVRLIKFMGLLDPPRPSWGLMYTGCLLPLQGLDPPTKMDSVETHDTLTDERRHDRISEPVQSGRLALRWTHPRYDPVGIEYALTPQNAQLHFRLRQLTALLLHTYSLATIKEGQLSFHYTPPEGLTTTVALRTPPGLLLTASTPDVVALPANNWPAPLRIRFSEQARSSDSALLRSLLDQMSDQLLSDGHTLVTRDTEQDRLVRIQQQHLSPQFQDHTSPGHWIGANVLLDVTVSPSSPGTRSIRVTALAIDTGQILGAYTVEAPITAWETSRVSISSQLRALLPAPSSNTRAGILIDERRP